MVKFMANLKDFPPASKRYSWQTRRCIFEGFPSHDTSSHTRRHTNGHLHADWASAVAVGYAIFIGFFVMRTLSFRDLPDVLNRAAMTSAIVLLLVGAAMAFKTVVSLSCSRTSCSAICQFRKPPHSAVLNDILLFIVGMFLDAGRPSYTRSSPGPIFLDLGIHPVHSRDYNKC